MEVERRNESPNRMCYSKHRHWMPQTRSRLRRVPLGVIEHVKSLCSEFQAHSLGKGEVFEQRHVEISAMWVAEDIATGVAEREPSRCGKGGRIGKQRSIVGNRTVRKTRVGVTYEVSARRRTNPVGYSSIIAREDYAIGRTSTELGNT